MSTYRIPKLTDLELIKAFTRIKLALRERRRFRLTVQIANGNASDLPDENPEATTTVAFYVALNGRTIPQFYLVDEQTGAHALRVTRKPELAWDEATLVQDWISNLPPNLRNSPDIPEISASLASLAQKDLRVDELHASMMGSGNVNRKS